MATVSGGSAVATQGRGLNIGLWVAQALLAVAFIGSGMLKLVTPYEELARQMLWVQQSPAALIKFIGAVEVLGAIGLILPALTRIKPVLTPLAALGLLVIMVLAAGTHIAFDEAQMVVPNIILGGLAAFVAWGRFKKAPIAPKA
jgi:uncharacterized membrane protein YphA (DoxX/SURF4 family)